MLQISYREVLDSHRWIIENIQVRYRVETEKNNINSSEKIDRLRRSLLFIQCKTILNNGGNQYEHNRNKRSIN